MNTALSKRLRLLASAVSVLLLVAIVAIGWIYARVRASLPLLDGSAAIPGLTAAVTVERDALGVPTIRAQSRTDVARGIGFLHAQDRFFQIDVWRRSAAGEMSAVFGERTLPHDRLMRQHGFRRLAQTTLARLPAGQRELLEAYAAGVNAGLAALGEKPFEYIAVRAEPAPWKPEDTLLVYDAMLLDLQDETGEYDRTLMALRDTLGAQGLAFFAPLLTPADAALDGSTGDVASIPGPQVINLRAGATAATTRNGGGGAPMPSFLRPELETQAGSNAFALAGAHTANGAALLACDMHLNLRVPNTWYRASFEHEGRRITGITVPGTPLMICGSNGKVAWGFTNAYADTGDVITIDTNPVSPVLYPAPGRAELLEIEKRKEVIEVRGEEPTTVTYEWTIWGPVIGRDENGRLMAYLWTGHDPAAVNLDLVEMEGAADVSQAVDIAHRAGMPTLNLVVADSAGDVAWTLAGRLPRRVGYDGRTPVTFQFADRSWNGFVPPDEIPVVTTKPAGRGNEIPSSDGRIWSANQRMMGGPALGILGDGGYARPARAAQIRDRLKEIERATPRDLLSVQLDDRALFLNRWHKLLLDTLTPEVIASKEVRGKLREYAEKWEGRASVDAVSYPIVRIFRVAVYGRVFSSIFSSGNGKGQNLRWSQLLLEPAIWKMIKEKPVHLLAPEFPSWEALLVAAVDDTVTELNRTGVRLPYATWGHRNRGLIRHPLSYSLPWFLRSRLDMPPDPLPGDVDMPRVQTPNHGASERFVVAPGHESEGIFHMPVGQSGHPLSPYYRAGHEAWVRGEPTPFLPGKTEHTLMLTPATAGQRK